MNKINSLRMFFEQNGFEVCSKLANILGIRTKNVRLFFIYASFTTIIGGFLIYLILGFWIKLKDMIYTKRSSVFDL
jgi:phage shock protein PspC (stress-responsive transcriptional regulator)